MRLVRTLKPADLEPGIGKVARPVLAEQQQAADSGHFASLALALEVGAVGKR